MQELQLRDSRWWATGARRSRCSAPNQTHLLRVGARQRRQLRDLQPPAIYHVGGNLCTGQREGPGQRDGKGSWQQPRRNNRSSQAALAAPAQHNTSAPAMPGWRCPRAGARSAAPTSLPQRHTRQRPPCAARPAAPPGPALMGAWGSSASSSRSEGGVSSMPTAGQESRSPTN